MIAIEVSLLQNFPANTVGKASYALVERGNGLVGVIGGAALRE
jgi:hypothetical protein